MRSLYLIVALAALAASPAAFAQELSSDTILCQLDPTCGLPPPGPSKCPPGMTCRSLIKSDEIAPPKENVSSLHVGFEFNSAVLQNDARITLDELGKALVNRRLQHFIFRIEGHTDAKGSDAYNKVLSERRARAVRNYLVANFDIDPGRLEVEGFGSQRLLDPKNPLDGVNRRVQIVNVTAPTSRR